MQRDQRPVVDAVFTEEQSRQILQYGLLFIIVIVAVKLLAAALVGLSVVAIPALIYAYQTVPSNVSFDVKKELKRVLRGVHLPEDHPEKPKTWLEQTVARVQASVATEVATGLGYDLTFINLLGCATLAFVRVPSARVDCYWLGVFGKWQYITTRPIQDKQKAN
jgi:hypothetical protein